MSLLKSWEIFFAFNIGRTIIDKLGEDIGISKEDWYNNMKEIGEQLEGERIERL